MPPLDTPDGPRRYLRSHYAGVVLVGETVFRRRFVVDPASGKVVLALSAAAGEAESVVFHVPDEHADGLHILVEPRVLPEGALSDRLLVYHGRAEGTQFAMLEPLDAKWRGQGLELEQVLAPNPLVKDEPKLCRLINTTPDGPARLLRLLGARETHEPLVVGIDPWGLDVRSRVGMTRVEFREQMPVDQVFATIEGWLRST